MLYRTKAAAEILMGLTAKEAFELSEMVRHIQKRFYIGTRMIPFENIPKDDARDRIQCILNDGTLDIPIQMRGPLERFLEVMVKERAPMDMLVEEYNTALSQVFQPDLFKPEATQDGPPQTGWSRHRGHPQKNSTYPIQMRQAPKIEQRIS